MPIKLDEIHRFSADEYHALIDAGGFDEDLRAELIDGLLVKMGPKTPAHENAVAVLLERVFDQVDRDRFHIGRSPLTLGNSEPEPDLIVFADGTDAPYHPSTAALVAEVAADSQVRDLEVKPSLYANAGVPVYWVIDVDRGRGIQHSEPIGDGYGRVEIVTELTAPHLGVSIAVADVLSAR